MVDIRARELWTPHGLRSLAPNDPRRVSVYRGGPRRRDGAYHQGTVWPWLLGAFVTAHYRVYKDASRARSFLTSIIDHLDDAGLGSTGEVFDGDAPHEPRGCYAQAWSVAEVLRAWIDLDACNESD